MCNLNNATFITRFIVGFLWQLLIRNASNHVSHVNCGFHSMLPVIGMSGGVRMYPSLPVIGIPGWVRTYPSLPVYLVQ